MKLAVVIPSYPREHQEHFLGRAIRSVLSAAERAEVEVDIVIALDEGAKLPSLDELWKGVRVSCGGIGGQAPEHPDPLPTCAYVRVSCGGIGGQASATNAAMNTIDSDWVAFLEDDDYWARERLRECFSLELEYGPFDFTSSTSLEITEHGGQVCRVNDFPIPSGWLFRREVWQTVGEFDPEFRVHHDNEWLGRLGNSHLARVHLVESTAPTTREYLAVRPWLRHVLAFGGRNSVLLRTGLSDPLLVRAIHKGQGEARFKTDIPFTNQSNREYQLCQQRYGRIPW